MAGTGRIKGTNGTIADRAVELGTKLASQPDQLELSVRLMLTEAQRRMVLELCGVFDLSARSVLNAALRYALHIAKQSGISVRELDCYPDVLSGAEITFELNVGTLALVREAEVFDSVANCTAAGIELLYAANLGSIPTV